MALITPTEPVSPAQPKGIKPIPKSRATKKRELSGQMNRLFNRAAGTNGSLAPTAPGPTAPGSGNQGQGNTNQAPTASLAPKTLDNPQGNPGKIDTSSMRTPGQAEMAKPSMEQLGTRPRTGSLGGVSPSVLGPGQFAVPEQVPRKNIFSSENVQQKYEERTLAAMTDAQKQAATQAASLGGPGAAMPQPQVPGAMAPLSSITGLEPPMNLEGLGRYAMAQRLAGFGQPTPEQQQAISQAANPGAGIGMPNIDQQVAITNSQQPGRGGSFGVPNQMPNVAEQAAITGAMNPAASMPGSDMSSERQAVYQEEKAAAQPQAPVQGKQSYTTEEKVANKETLDQLKNSKNPVERRMWEKMRDSYRDAKSGKGSMKKVQDQLAYAQKFQNLEAPIPASMKGVGSLREQARAILQSRMRGVGADSGIADLPAGTKIPRSVYGNTGPRAEAEERIAGLPKTTPGKSKVLMGANRVKAGDRYLDQDDPNTPRDYKDLSAADKNNAYKDRRKAAYQDARDLRNERAIAEKDSKLEARQVARMRLAEGSGSGGGMSPQALENLARRDPRAFASYMASQSANRLGRDELADRGNARREGRDAIIGNQRYQEGVTEETRRYNEKTQKEQSDLDYERDTKTANTLYERQRTEIEANNALTAPQREAELQRIKAARDESLANTEQTKFATDRVKKAAEAEDALDQDIKDFRKRYGALPPSGAYPEGSVAKEAWKKFNKDRNKDISNGETVEELSDEMTELEVPASKSMVLAEGESISTFTSEQITREVDKLLDNENYSDVDLQNIQKYMHTKGKVKKDWFTLPHGLFGAGGARFRRNPRIKRLFELFKSEVPITREAINAA